MNYLGTDPHEQTSLADKPEHTANVTELISRLAKGMASHDDKHPLTVYISKPSAWMPPTPGEPQLKQREKTTKP